MVTKVRATTGFALVSITTLIAAAKNFSAINAAKESAKMSGHRHQDRGQGLHG